MSLSIWLHVSMSKSELCIEMTELSRELIDLNDEKSKSGRLCSGDSVSASGEPGDRSRLGQGLILFGVASRCCKLNLEVPWVSCWYTLVATLLTDWAFGSHFLSLIILDLSGSKLPKRALDFFLSAFIPSMEPELRSDELLEILCLLRFSKVGPVGVTVRGSMPNSSNVVSSRLGDNICELIPAIVAS